MRPVVSVIVPMLDAQEHLEVLFASLLAQDFDQPWEIIAVDNGSRDLTVQTARSLLGGELPMNLVRCEIASAPSARGYATPRNEGVKLAAAPLLAFCDADGAVDGQWLASITRALQDNPLVASRKFRSPDIRSRNVEKAWSDLTKPMTLLSLPYAETGGLGCTRKLFDDLSGFDVYFDLGGEDVDFSLRARFELGIEPVLEPSAMYWSKSSTRVRGAFAKGFRDGRSQVRLYQRHRGRHSHPPKGLLSAIRQLLRIIWRFVRMNPRDRKSRVRLAGEFGRLCGRVVWSVRLRVRSV